MQHNDENTFEIEKQIYNTQWQNIRNHWDETIRSTRYLSTLIVFAILPLKFLKISKDGTIGVGPLTEIDLYLKAFVVAMIAILGLLTLLNQINHYKRSKEARKVVVEIERNWGLYGDDGRFIYQGSETNYSFGKFAGGEKRVSHSHIQFGYIIAIQCHLISDNRLYT